MSRARRHENPGKRERDREALKNAAPQAGEGPYSSRIARVHPEKPAVAAPVASSPNGAPTSTLEVTCGICGGNDHIEHACPVRSKREPHPEDFCQKCGRPNAVWFAPSDLWNKAVRDAEAPEILCPVCFIGLAEVAGIKPTAWKVAPEEHETRVAPSAVGENETPECPKGQDALVAGPAANGASGFKPERCASEETLTSSKQDTCQSIRETLTPDESNRQHFAPSETRTFSDFIRNATEEEKRAVYEDVMRRAADRQNASVAPSTVGGSDGDMRYPCPNGKGCVDTMACERSGKCERENVAPSSTAAACECPQEGQCFGMVSWGQTCALSATRVESAWVPVSERLPEHSGYYHVWTDGPHDPLRRNGTATAYFYTTGTPGWRLLTGDGEITHWMPLPKSPEPAPASTGAKRG